ncbi:MAG TPA: ABC transporter ATP-binding protein, partial [Methanosarcina vacuolata]|nr:ABC transporter ATP-binding protein [Methanosarcina vacuolata]
MKTKISIKDVSVPGDLILETETANSTLEVELPSREGLVNSNEESFKCKLGRSRYLQSDETHKIASPIIQVIDIKKSYILGDLEVPVLRDINLKVREGEFLAIMGPSGSGKSTLMNLIGFLDRPTEGTIIIKGLDINKLSDKEVARLRGLEIGFVFQTFNLIPRLTALENVELPTYANTRSGIDTHESTGILNKFKQH